MALGIYGKHPAKGDFMAHGLPAALQTRLESWLDATLAEARAALGSDWQAVWPAAPHLHFWLGEGIWGEPVAGLMAPAQDKVGRRFPLVYLATGADAPPPPIAGGGQDWHRALSAHAAAALARPEVDQPADLLAELPRPELAEGVTAVTPPEFWAVRPGPEVAALWQDVTLADHRRAAANRSYWWTEGALAPAVAEEPEPAPQEEADPPPPPPDEDVWALAGVHADDEQSPFAGPAPGLFAPPAPAEAAVAEPAPLTAAPDPAPAAPMPRPAQVWAGPGLPGGAVLAWFFRGHAGKDQRDVD
jgi:type VI secretion system ImpM family protein